MEKPTQAARNALATIYVVGEPPKGVHWATRVQYVDHLSYNKEMHRYVVSPEVVTQWDLAAHPLVKVSAALQDAGFQIDRRSFRRNNKIRFQKVRPGEVRFVGLLVDGSAMEITAYADGTCHSSYRCTGKQDLKTKGLRELEEALKGMKVAVTDEERLRALRAGILHRLAIPDPYLKDISWVSAEDLMFYLKLHNADATMLWKAADQLEAEGLIRQITAGFGPSMKLNQKEKAAS